MIVEEGKSVSGIVNGKSLDRRSGGLVLLLSFNVFVASTCSASTTFDMRENITLLLLVYTTR